MKTKNKGQGLVEFALILPLLLLVVFMIIESGRAFQAWNTLRNAAERAARYAVTGQQEAGSTRLESIKNQAIEASRSLAISQVEADGPPYILFDTPDALIVRVFGGPNTEEDNPGGPGERVLVEVTYNFRLLTPFLADRGPFIRLNGSAEMLNEDFGALLASQGGAPPPLAPTLAPIPTIGPAPIDILEPLFHGELQVQGTAHPSRTVRLTDLDDPTIDLTTTVGADGVFSFDLASIGKHLIDGHRIQVEGLDGYNVPADVALVEPAAPIVILEPLVQGDTIVKGVAQRNETLAITDTTDSAWPANGTTVVVGPAGNFTFNLGSGLQSGHIIRVGGYGQYDEATVLAAVPIIIDEPLLPGRSYVLGTAKKGATLTITDLDDSSWAANGTTTTVDPNDGTFFFSLSYALQGGHIIQVTGYGESDTATVLTPTPTPTATPAPIVIDEPVFEGDRIVTGRATPGATLRLRDLNDPSRTIDLTTTANASGIFSFNVTSVAPDGFVVGHTLAVQGYGQVATTVVQPLSSGLFVSLTPSCRDTAGPASIQVNGFNWPTNRGDILIYWDGGLVTQFTPSAAHWQKTINVFVSEGQHTVLVETQQQNNTNNFSTTFQVPCTSPPLSSPLDLTITGLSVVGTQPFTTYAPLTFNVVVSNPITYPINNLFWVDLYLDPAQQPPSADDLRLEFSVDYQAIAALGARSNITLTMRHSQGVSVTGVYTYYALADTFNQIIERDEDNNVGPALVISVSVPGTPPSTPVPTATPTGTPPAPGRISGVTLLVAGAAAQPQGRVDVSLINETGVVVATTQSHRQTGNNDPTPEGFYEFIDVAPGNYRLSASYRQGNTNYCGEILLFNLAPGEDKTNMTILLTTC